MTLTSRGREMWDVTVYIITRVLVTNGSRVLPSTKVVEYILPRITT